MLLSPVTGRIHARAPRRLTLSILLCCAVLLSGCILPPPKVQSRVLPAEELKVVSMVKRGKDFALGGRYDLAEQQFRAVLAIEPTLISIYNDLGFALQGQDRLREAKLWLLKALDADPTSYIAGDNLGRVLYEQGEYEEAARHYQRLLEGLYQSGDVSTAQGRTREAAIYRNLSAIYYTLGFIDDSLCYSGLVLKTTPDIYETGRHVRLLLSLDKVPDALNFLRSSITTVDNPPPKIFLDYGIALYASGNFSLSEEAFSHVLARPEGDYSDRRRARVLRALARKQRLDPDRMAEEIAELKAADEKLCESRKTVEEPYWPHAVGAATAQFLEGVCEDENRSIFWH